MLDTQQEKIQVRPQREEKKPHVLCLGERGFPRGFGAIQRQLLIAKGMVKSGCKVTVLSFKGTHRKDVDFPPTGVFEDVHYRYTSGNIHRPSGFLRRNWNKVVGKFNELAYIRKLNKRGELAGCLVSTAGFGDLLHYWAWLKINGIPMVLNYDEFNTARPERSDWKQKVNDFFFDNLAPFLTDGVSPISNFLSDHVRKRAGRKPIYKFPILCDFDKFDPTPRKSEGIVFTYCGAASYLELIRFVLAAFDQLEINDKKVYLEFILGGSQRDLKKVQDWVDQSKNGGSVRINANVPHSQIPEYYAGATALLIPLRPTVPDKARFPHKLGEYLASGRAVITTKYGEIRNYDFIDEKTALVAESYAPDSFAEKMKFVIDHPDKARQIGQRGREMGFRNFNYKDIGMGMKNFILSLRNGR